MSDLRRRHLYGVWGGSVCANALHRPIVSMAFAVSHKNEVSSESVH